MKRDQQKPVLPGEDPAPYDVMPYGEQPRQKSITFKNYTDQSIAIGRMASDWRSVNFVIGSCEFRSKKIKWMATLDQGDTIELNFLPPDEITP